MSFKKTGLYYHHDYYYLIIIICAATHGLHIFGNPTDEPLKGQQRHHVKGPDYEKMTNIVPGCSKWLRWHQQNAVVLDFTRHTFTSSHVIHVIIFWKFPTPSPGNMLCRGCSSSLHWLKLILRFPFDLFSVFSASF